MWKPVSISLKAEKLSRKISGVSEGVKKSGNVMLSVHSRKAVIAQDDRHGEFIHRFSVSLL